METTNKIDYKALCEAPFDMDSTYEVNFRMLVYTGRKEEERPVFRVVIAKGECKVCIGAACKELGYRRVGSGDVREPVVQL